MAYCARADMVTRFGEDELIGLTDRYSQGVIDGAVLDRAIADATEHIDRKLRGKYVLPFSTPPTELVQIACDLARFFMYDKAVPDTVQARADAALKEMRDYATGVNTLDVPGVAVDISPKAPAVIAATAVFSADLLAKMP